MKSFKFFQKRVVLLIHHCLVIILTLSLASCTHSAHTAMNDKIEVQRDPATVIKPQDPGFYLLLKKEPFSHYRPRRHRISGNVYGQEYKERMKTEKTGVVVYQCTPQEGTEDTCEAITEIVSLAELRRKLESIDSANKGSLAMFLGALCGGLVAFAGMIIFPPSAPAAPAIVGTGVTIAAGGIVGTAALAVKESDNYSLRGYLENLQGSEDFIYTRDNLVDYKNALIRLTSQIVKDRR